MMKMKTMSFIATVLILLAIIDTMSVDAFRLFRFGRKQYDNRFGRKQYDNNGNKNKRAMNKQTTPSWMATSNRVPSRGSTNSLFFKY